MHQQNKLGLLLTAGGARGAYQAGVLQRIGEIPRLHNSSCPFKIITGASAGAINGVALAAWCMHFKESTNALAKVWENLSVDQVFRTDTLSMGSIAATWIKDLSLGGLMGGGSAQSLLNTDPLREFLLKSIPFERIQDGIDQGHLYAVAIVASNYFNGKSCTFIQGQHGHPLWTKARRSSYSVKINVNHVAASSAIPVVFPPVMIESEFGNYYYGDGALRLVNPFSPAIRLGASKIFAIGIRSQKAAEEKMKANLEPAQSHPTAKPPTMADVFGVALNAIFLDHLDTDLDHLIRMNELIDHSSKSASTMKEPMKKVEPFVIYPSLDLGSLADEYSDKMPGTVRYMMEGLGRCRTESSDLMSYLLFDSSYTRALVEVGYQDAHSKIDEIENFIFS